MAAIHDIKCTNPDCGHESYDALVIPDRLPFCLCGSAMEIRWDISQRVAPVTIPSTVHPREQAVVWHNERTGSVAYPPMNNVPMPERYSANGYERKELNTLAKLDKFCKDKNVTNEKTTYNSGNGV